ncbi:MAG: PPOX class F420-dependent oxidoreductase [Gammaproteobacteria bacterium]|jgi:uncharacterized protein|nr:PPOX class F420-dependent oxidoreductase [Gammaproteobacteria bacterium]MBT4492134.1 PPOX class F420-dependent oxidoreductase [Gammaproteobacteria bacterium]
MMNLEAAKYISLRTFRKSGVPVDTPVWFASADSNKHYVFSAADAGKVKRLRNSAKAQIATCDGRGGSLGEWTDCESYLVDDSEEIQSAYRCLNSKYGWMMKITDFFSRLSGRINHRAVIRIET